MSYSITIDETTKPYARLNDATKFADKKALELGIEVEVLHTETQAVAYVTSPRGILKRDEGIHFVPFTRVETPKHHAPDFPGFVPAYTRSRIGATVYRGQERGAWLVFDGRTGGHVVVANTTESRHLLTAMKNGHQLPVQELANA